MINDNLSQVESAVTASSSGDLSWDHWSLDAVVALGFSGQRNPLGFAMVRYLSEPPAAANIWRIVLTLETQLRKRGVDGSASRDFAWRAFDFWRDNRCRSCEGRGFSGTNAHQCPSCGGSGKRPISDDAHDSLRTAISLLLDAEQWMEGQLAARRRRGG